MISDSNYMLINIRNFFTFSITAICLIVSTDIMTFYDIIIYYTEVFIG